MTLAQKPRRDLRLQIHLSGFVFKKWPEQKIEISVNKVVVGHMSLKDRTVKTVEFVIPSDVITQEGLIDLSFKYLNPVRQNEIGASEDSRLQSIAITSLVLDQKNLEENPTKSSDAP